MDEGTVGSHEWPHSAYLRRFSQVLNPPPSQRWPWCVASAMHQFCERGLERMSER